MNRQMLGCGIRKWQFGFGKKIPLSGRIDSRKGSEIYAISGKYTKMPVNNLL